MTLSIHQKSEYSGRGRWNWSIWIDGPGDELRHVAQVRYQLNRERRPPSVVVTNRRTKFRLDSSGKSEFTLRAEVTFTDDREPLRLRHKLRLQRAEEGRGGKSPSRNRMRNHGAPSRTRTGSPSREIPDTVHWLAHSAPAAGESPLEATQAPQTHVMFIHGIANKPDAESLLRDWLDALARSGGVDLRQPGIVVSMVYWADVLYAEPALELVAAESLAPSEELLNGVSPDWQRELSPQEQRFVEALGDRMRTASQQANPELIAEETAGRAEERVPLPWFVKEPVMERILRDVHHYLFNVEYSPRPGETYKVQDEIRRRFVTGLQSVSAPNQIVVSHSMGTVIAYDCLKRVAGCPSISTLITIGSPLGLDEVQDKLQPGWTREDGFPSSNARHWVNVYDRFDPVCGFDPDLANDFRKAGQKVIEDINEQNSGWWRHDIQKYLSGPRLRDALRRALRGTGIGVGATGMEEVQIRTEAETRREISLAAFLDSLRNALDTFDHERVANLCDHFVEQLRVNRGLPSARESAELLSQLRRKRAFQQMRQVADALVESGQTAPSVRRQYIQAMIDEGAIAAGLSLAEDLACDLERRGPEDPEAASELAEARGLIGRCYKQWYVQSGENQYLEEAIAAYDSVYRRSPGQYLWHGINVAALLARASPGSRRTSRRARCEEIARNTLSVVEDLERRKKAQYWDLATAMEACVALGRTDDAVCWAVKYVRSPGTDAFELGSTLRQLKEVWQLDAARDPGSLLLPLLKSELLTRSGGRVTIDSSSVVTSGPAEQAAGGQLEKVFGRESYKNFRWLMLAYERGRGVARIETRTGQGVGTGFLVRGGDLKVDWGDEFVLLTNYHVVNRAGEGNALTGEQAFVRFRSPNPISDRTHEITEILAQSPQNSLDFAVARLEPPVSLSIPWTIAPRAPDPQAQQRLYAIGHPMGGDLSISLQDNLLLDFEAPLLHYRTPTDPGSSGSPIFDDEWNLLALHHSGSKQTPRLHGDGTYEANEGIWIESIRIHLESSTLVRTTPRFAIRRQSSPVTNVSSTFQSMRTRESSFAPVPRKSPDMSDMHKQDQLRQFVSQIASPDRLESLRVEAPAMVESATFESMEAVPAHLEATPEAAESALRKIQTGEPLTTVEMSSMEAIILPKERPVVFIENDTFSTPESPWEHFSNPEIKSRIEAAIPSIGRVELPSNPQIPFGGTAFVVGPGILMTNRHVAELFAAGLGRQVTFRTGQSAGWDSHRERRSPPGDETVLDVRRILLIHPFWDMALLEVSGLRAAQRPLTLAVVPPEELVGIDVAVIGYPAKDLRNDSDLQDRIFHRTFNVKRLQPGKINPRETITSFGNTVSALTHDSSTLGGNSGSAIIDAHTGAVVGLHFAGLYLKSNYAVPTWELARDRRVVGLGVNFSGLGAAEDPNVARVWKRLEPNEIISDGISVIRPPAVKPVAVSGGTKAASVRFEIGNLSFSIPVEVAVTSQAAPSGTVVETVSADGLIEAKPPVVFPRLDKRDGYDADFLKLGEPVPLPELTTEGKKIVARLDDGSPELKYHKFSVVMHKFRRMALYTASNVDYRDKVRKINGKKPSRKELNGFVTDSSELWTTDERIPENQQLPDKFYTKDGGAFDKGHIVRRDDVCWGSSFKDMQKGNGDTFHTTNCSPQVSGFNQSAQGEDNWGDLEAMIQQQTKAEQVIVFAGPVLDDEEDLRFEGIDKRGEVSIQIPSRYWKIVVAKGQNGPEAFGFLLEQDLSDVALEFAVPTNWRRYMEKISEIEDLLFGRVSLDWLKRHDQYEALRGRRRR